MLQLSALHKAFGARVLFDDVTWQVQAGDRVGLCGPNGAGKTTLLRMLAGLDEPDSGVITHPADLTVGYLPQDGLIHAGHTLFAEAKTAFEDLLSLQSEMRQLEAQLGDASVPATMHERMLTRYSEVQDAFRHQGGYDIESRVTAVLWGLGFSGSDFDRPTDTFSGGWQMRIALAKLLLRRPRLLLMDEPTNHLDLEARNWLEEFLVGYPHAVVLVSHDRFFLDRVVTAITEIGLRTLTTIPGSYTKEISHFWLTGQMAGEQKDGARLSLHGPPHVEGNRVYLSYGEGGAVIVDISDLAQPKLVSQLFFKGITNHHGIHTFLPLPRRQLALINDEAINENGEECLNMAGIVDIREGREPQLISLFPQPVPPSETGLENFFLKGGRFGPHNQHHPNHQPCLQDRDDIAYLTYFNAGLRVYDIRDARSPKEIAYFIPSDPENRIGTKPSRLVVQSEDVLVDRRGYIYISHKNQGIYIHRLKNPWPYRNSNPV